MILALWLLGLSGCAGFSALSPNAWKKPAESLNPASASADASVSATNPSDGMASDREGGGQAEVESATESAGEVQGGAGGGDAGGGNSGGGSGGGSGGS